MKTYQVLLVEDNPADAQLLMEYSRQVPFLTIAGIFDNAMEARAFLTDQAVDLLVVDIYMPRLTGLDLVRGLPKPPVVILTTNSLTDAVEAYELGAIDYLVKPFRFERFLRAANRALPKLIAAEVTLPSATIYLKEGRASVQVVLDEIIRVEAFGNFCRVFLPDRMLFVTHTISDLATQLVALPTPRFIRVHRSHVVAVQKISRYTPKELYIGEQRIPVADTHRASVQALMMDRMNLQA